MSYCLNPECKNPKNTTRDNVCRGCKSQLLLRQRYRALDILGQGGFGKTFLARDEDKPSKPKCVIKQFYPDTKIRNDSYSLEKATNLFREEAKRLEELGHHNQIPELYAYFDLDGDLYLVQEFIDGQNLLDEFKNRSEYNDREIELLLDSLLPVLEFIHQNKIIHRDIKPANLIRRKQDGKIILVDFGVAKLATETSLLKPGTSIGSYDYAPPEQILYGRVSFANDIYSLGATCLYLLTKNKPPNLFDSSLNKWIWREYLKYPIENKLGLILDRMVDINIDKRYKCVSEVIEVLKLLNLSKEENRFTKLIPVWDSAEQAYGYKNERDEIVIPPQFQSAHIFKENLAAIRINNKWGFIDRSGKIIIETQFDDARDFTEGTALIIIDNKLGFINRNGKLISKLKSYIELDFKNGLAAVKIDNKWGFIKKNLEISLNPTFKEARNFSEGLAAVKFIDKWGFVDRDLKIVIPYNFDEVRDFNQGLAAVKINDKWGFIDLQGTIVSELKYYTVSNFKHGLAAVKINDKWGFVDRDINIVIPPKFDRVRDFSEGLAAVKINGLLRRQRYINKEGKFI